MTISETASIHPTAIVEDGACLGDGVSVGPYSIIGSEVKIGAETTIDAHVVLSGRTTLGVRNTIFPFASIGAIPQDLKFSGEKSELLIGDENTIREYVTLQPGTKGGGMITKIGHKNLFMAGTHVGHDCLVGDGNILANSAALSGHVELGDGVTIGGLCGIHQFVRLGSYSFLGGGAMVVQDIPPYCLAQGDRAYLFGLNVVGLKRNGFSNENIRALKECYRELFVRSGKLKEKIALVRETLSPDSVSPDSVSSDSAVESLLVFLESSSRGVTSAKQEESNTANRSSGESSSRQLLN